MKNDNAPWEVQVRKVCSKWVPTVDSFSYRFHGAAKWHFSPIFRIRNAWHSFNQSFISSVTWGATALRQVATDSDTVMGFTLPDTQGTRFVIAVVADGFVHLTDSYWGARKCSPLPDFLPGCPGGPLCPWHTSLRSAPTWPAADLWSWGSSKEGLLFNFQI